MYVITNKYKKVFAFKNNNNNFVLLSMYLAHQLYQLIGDTFVRTGPNLLHDF